MEISTSVQRRTWNSAHWTRTRPFLCSSSIPGHSMSDSTRSCNVRCYIRRWEANGGCGFVTWRSKSQPWPVLSSVSQTWMLSSCICYGIVSPVKNFPIGIDDQTLSLAILELATKKMSMIRDDLTEMCSAILYSYRRNCAASTSASQVRAEHNLPPEVEL